MKKIVLLCFTMVCITSFAQKRRMNNPEIKDFSSLLFSALLGTEEEQKIPQILKEAADYYKDDLDGYAAFMRTRDEAGWHVISHYAARGDAEVLDTILNTLVRLKRTLRHMFGTITLKDIYGRTALYLAISRKELDVVQTLVDFMLKHYGNDKERFNAFINSYENQGGWTPLILAAFNGHFHIVETLLKAMEKAFGKDSAEFKNILNYRDNNGYAAIDFATSRVKELLKSYGAKEGHAHHLEQDNGEEDNNFYSTPAQGYQYKRNNTYSGYGKRLLGCRDRYCSCRCKRVIAR